MQRIAAFLLLPLGLFTGCARYKYHPAPISPPAEAIVSPAHPCRCGDSSQFRWQTENYSSPEGESRMTRSLKISDCSGYNCKCAEDISTVSILGAKRKSCEGTKDSEPLSRKATVFPMSAILCSLLHGSLTAPSAFSANHRLPAFLGAAGRITTVIATRKEARTDTSPDLFVWFGSAGATAPAL
jgi:hypothetical protein